MQLKGYDASVDPSFCLRSSFASSPFQSRSKAAPIMGLTWESQGS